MSVYIFYHIFCNENTHVIVKEQLQNIMFSGLYYNVNKIYCFLLGSSEHRDLLKTNVIEKYGSKIIIADESDNANLYERFTLLQIKKYIKPEDKFLYIHSKGITRFNNDNYKFVLDWRIYMEFFLFTQSQNILKKLDEYNLGGCFYKTEPSNHFSGNFWWTTGKYYLTLPDNIEECYYAPEMYIFKGESPKFCKLDECNTNYNYGYSCEFPSKNYIDKYIIGLELPQPPSNPAPAQNIIEENIDKSIKNIDKSIELIKSLNAIFSAI